MRTGPRAGSLDTDDASMSSTNVEKQESFVHTFRHCWPLLFALLFLGGTSFGVATMVKTFEIDPIYGNWTMAQYRQDATLGEGCRAVDHEVPWRELKRKLLRCRRGQYYDPMHNDCAECPADSPDDKVFAVFWETQSNCQNLVGNPHTRFLTHIMWSFVEPGEDGTVPSEFQYWSQEHIKDCILQLRMYEICIHDVRCIKNMVAIGGVTARERFLELKDPANLERFKHSYTLKCDVVVVVAYVRFGFDGIDIDDETGNMKGTHQDWLTHHGPVVVNYLQALRDGLDAIQRPDEPRYLLTWDEFPSAWDPPDPANEHYTGCISFHEDYDGWHRCYEPRISALVDMVNVMFYNIDSGDVRIASWVYELVLKDTLPVKAAAVIPKNKIVVDACSGQGCVSDQPIGQEVYNAGNGSAFYRGTMLWSATIDILLENLSSISRMGRAGNYGVKMPFRGKFT
ncbi:hypothetical protein AaE_007714 [Aphanomyces astaci]|uniref:GH18 domain-containing protein n=1 Tax=Aphanomyces astaci TaxID=112090 RepID=A0A6A5AFL9_APHAT|nr:hypothetical protein AaE_007714 [Aphanomyces astaci]